MAHAAHGLARCLLQEGVTSQTSHWSRLYFMTFYIVTMVGPHHSRPRPLWAAGSERKAVI